jgi:RimJ/RimL family protein N-acetyltransferase
MSVTTSKIRLTALAAADAKAMFQWINDRDLVLRSAPFKPVSEARHRAWFEQVQRRDDVAIFGIRLHDSDKLIGYCQLRGIDPVHRSAELQIRLGAKGEWGKGYGTEAVTQLLRFAFKDRNLNRVYLHVLSSNAPAIRIYRKAGFRNEGLMKAAAFIDGRFVDVLLMALLNPSGKRMKKDLDAT